MEVLEPQRGQHLCRLHLLLALQIDLYGRDSCSYQNRVVKDLYEETFAYMRMLLVGAFVYTQLWPRCAVFCERIIIEN